MNSTRLLIIPLFLALAITACGGGGGGSGSANNPAEEIDPAPIAAMMPLSS